MSGIALVTPVAHASDGNIDIQFVGINFDQSRVIIRLKLSPGGGTKDYTVGNQPTDIATIAQLVAAVNNFAGLRVALLQYLQTLDSTLTGSVT